MISLIMLGENTEDTQGKNSDQEKAQEEDDGNEFKKPEGPPPKWRDSPSIGNASCVGNSREQESLTNYWSKMGVTHF